jgi:ribonuclease HI
MITIYFDGLCYPKNPGGVAAYGYLIYDDGKLIHRGFGAVGEGRGMTNNVAEYEGLMAAAQWIDDHEIKGSIEVKGDSQLVIRQIRGDWEIRSMTSRKYVPEIRRLLEGKDVRYIWVPREMNEEADQLSRRGYEAYKKRSQ